MRRTAMVVLLVSATILVGAKKKRADDEPTPAEPVVQAESSAPRTSIPTIEDLGYFLGRLDEWRKGEALNVLVDLAADSRLDRRDTAQVLNRLLDEGSPPPEFGYGCPTCFQKRLSALLEDLRLQGPKVAGPKTGFIALRVDERLLKKIDRKSRETFGGSLPAFVRALLDGYDPTGQWTSWGYPRYHGKGKDYRTEPVFFSSTRALSEHEESLSEPLDAWSLARYLCIDPPHTRYDPGFLLIEFDVTRACKEVFIPTAADCEEPSFRPTPESETEAGRTCGGAPEWVCPNFPLSATSGVRFVPNESYVRGLR